MEINRGWPLKPRQVTFGRFNWAAMEGELARNPVLNRCVIELIGYTSFRVALGRNKFESFEGLMDTVVWFVLGVGLPLMIQAPLSKWYTRKILKQFSMSNKAPLNIGLEKLDKSYLSSAIKKAELAKELGLKNASHLPKVANLLLTGKLLMIFIDLAFMSAKNQTYFWGRNKVTEMLSKKKGFSGEFNIATKEQLKTNAKEIEASEKKRTLISRISGFTYPWTMPVLLLGLMKSRVKPGNGNGAVGFLKKAIPHLNYHNVIYMNKWIVFWNCLFGWNLIGFLSARDKHERREHLLRCAVVDTFYFFGDDIISGYAGKMLEKRYKKQLAGIKLYEPGWMNIPIGRSVDTVVAEAQKTGKPGIIKIADKLARWNFRTGLLTTALLLGIGTTLINNWMTKKKIIEEQQKPKAVKLVLPSLQNAFLNQQQQQYYQRPVVSV